MNKYFLNKIKFKLENIIYRFIKNSSKITHIFLKIILSFVDFLIINIFLTKKYFRDFIRLYGNYRHVARGDDYHQIFWTTSLHPLISPPVSTPALEQWRTPR